jgi:urea transport system permease protein
MRDKEDRVRFSGYDVASFKVFVFCVAAAFSAIGGAMFTLQVGFMSPSFVGIVPSIEMVIFAAVGGRMSLLGAVWRAAGELRQDLLFRILPDLWLYLMAGCSSPWSCTSPMAWPACGTAMGARRWRNCCGAHRPWRKPGTPRPKPKPWRPSHDRRRL